MAIVRKWFSNLVWVADIDAPTFWGLGGRLSTPSEITAAGLKSCPLVRL